MGASARVCVYECTCMSVRVRVGVHECMCTSLRAHACVHEWACMNDRSWMWYDTTWSECVCRGSQHILLHKCILFVYNIIVSILCLSMYMHKYSRQCASMHKRACGCVRMCIHLYSFVGVHIRVRVHMRCFVQASVCECVCEYISVRVRLCARNYACTSVRTCLLNVLERVWLCMRVCAIIKAAAIPKFPQIPIPRYSPIPISGYSPIPILPIPQTADTFADTDTDIFGYNFLKLF